MRIIFLLGALACLALPAACGRQAAPVEISGLTMGTTYSVKLVTPNASLDTADIQSGIEAILADIDRCMSTYTDDSELSALNRNTSTGNIPISAELAAIISAALEISRFTHGAFDITVGPLVGLWGFGPEQAPPAIPPAERISQALARTGYHKLTLGTNPRWLNKSLPDLQLDLSGIAQGYAVDKIAAYLDGRGIENYMIEVGGEIKARGMKPGGTPWRIGIEKPVTDRRQVQWILRLDNMAMATSGDYRNYFEIDGKRYSHIIDPATGWPVAHDLVSVTVLGATAARADALATALMVMGPEGGVQFAGANDITAMFVIRNRDEFAERYTGSFARYLEYE
jgi:thiamine biosynthesis lipoprotein